MSAVLYIDYLPALALAYCLRSLLATRLLATTRAGPALRPVKRDV